MVVESDDRDAPGIIVPDVRVEEFLGGAPVPHGTAVADAEPMVLRFVQDEPMYQGFVEITDPSDGNRLVTVIEFLSPSNKRRGEGLQQYRRKQAECREAKVSFVEVDLIRTGTWALQIPLRSVPKARRAPFNVCVHRGWADNICEVYATPISRPLPKIRIPLRRRDADAVLDLQVLLNLAYENGAYEDRIDYAADADPPMTGDAAAWADDLLRKAGRRPPAA